MTVVPYPSDHERLVGNIRQELQAQRALMDLSLEDTALDSLSGAIATTVAYGFDVRWAPRWIEGDDPHRWTENPSGNEAFHFVECVRCRVISRHRTAGGADDWWSAHLAATHP